MPNSNPLFPSTTDELLKSHKTRPNHLSSDELTTIRSLVGAAVGAENTRLQSSTKNNAANANQTISGRRVLVPITSKGLFEGILDPPSDLGREQLIIHVGEGKFEQMSREDAGVFFDTNLKEMRSSSTKKNGKSAVTPRALTPSEKQHATYGKSNKLMVGRADQNETTTNMKSKCDNNKDDGESQLPFIEIREECDSSGKIVNAEVINISNQIERFDKLKQAKEGHGQGEKGFGELLADALKDGEHDIRTLNLDDDSLEVSKDTTATSETRRELQLHQSKQVISDTDYKNLCSRLEELERLEDTDAATRAGNTKSSKRSQSKGWSKGFLNAKPKSLSTDQKINRVTTNSKPINTQEAIVKMPMKQAARVPTINNTDDESKTDRKVSFSPEVDVKEVPPRASSVRHNQSNLGEVQDVDPFPPIATVPFEENIFKGVVKERTATNPMLGNEKNNTTLDNDGLGTQKKLSRFAMQRLQRR
ncbi:hypothetical protein HJC23_003314 [Cyclotella cryptica]|uniref:Uncharacterized protein n=1 Tax=Cyclotella cryptica TaxID=29204 RepID=A0ABD3QZT8_9STRA|eukprot:CCRYP_000869-RA/>CCRYP_000869-RA protein AED:0.08 eAED:0.08 QI:0/-1/0/1/-1/1/1/0/476